MTEEEVNSGKKEEKGAMCHICGRNDDRAVCHFKANQDSPCDIFIHVFCGKTAAILPNINRPDLEILTKAGIKNKHGTGVSVTLALQRCRSAKVADPTNREQEYYLAKEFEKTYLAVSKEPNEEEDNQRTEERERHRLGDVEPQTVPNPMFEEYSNSEAQNVPPDRFDHEPPNKRRKHEEMLPKSPYQFEMERLQQVCDRCRGVGYSLIRGVARDSDANEDDFDPIQCTQEQVDHVRVIVITKERQDRMEEMSKLILGEQHGQELMSFSTSFSYQVINAWNAFTVRFQEAADWEEKFDLLLGFTDTLKEHDIWMHDHEIGWGGEKMVRQLALSWSLVLRRNDQELGIDPEYTRPGIIALLEQFKEATESADEHGEDEPMKFEF